MSLLPPLTLRVFLLNRIEGTLRRGGCPLDIETWRVQKQVRKALRHIKTHSDRDDACLNPDVLLWLD